MSEPVNWGELLEQLSRPFPAALIQWRAGATNKEKTRAQALPYAEPRVYEDRLNSVCPGAWSVRFIPWGDTRVICELTIHGVTRASTGEGEGSPEEVKGTAAEAQAFKRACSKFGLGRYLYDLPAPWVGYDAHTRKLVETPRLPAPSLPAPLVPPATLSRERAQAMHMELSKLGFKRDEHYRFAERVTEREVKSLTTLTDAEALKTLNLARKEASRRAAGARVLVSDDEAAAILN